jgi:hypothetical protein
MAVVMEGRIASFISLFGFQSPFLKIWAFCSRSVELGTNLVPWQSLPACFQQGKDGIGCQHD